MPVRGRGWKARPDRHLVRQISNRARRIRSNNRIRIREKKMIGVKRNNRRWKSRFAMTAAPAALALALVRTTPALGTTYWWIDSSANWSFTNDWSLSQNGAQVFSVPSANSNVNIIDTDASPRTVAYDYTPGVTLNNLTVDQTGGGINTLNIPANNLSAANEFIGVNGRGYRRSRRRQQHYFRRPLPRRRKRIERHLHPDWRHIERRQRLSG